jgi:hypothetical protein
MRTTITDCFGNQIEVTDLPEAISQAQTFTNWSADGGCIFPEFKLIKTMDQFNKPLSYQKRTESGKYVRQRLYWKFILHKLLNLK